MRTLALVCLVSLGACRADSLGPAATEDSGTAPAPVCDDVQQGRWTALGPVFGMVMEGTLTFDASTCQFFMSDWTMTHPSQMWGGAIDGDTVYLNGTPGELWSSCTGTLEEGGTYMSGVCEAAANSGEFELSFNGE